ncbi:MAG: IspD/TarI family cytidylyltransferase [Spirochaetales bacterium]|jgi:2-C-methyl-D-erythritol 4-phosphate cytidylyltransferase|nr:IspD/TarI family cytidylyltransferase [Spirochaetales bacterium]
MTEQSMRAAALITAAGLSNRFNNSLSRQKKELMQGEGKSVLQRSIEAFLAVEVVDHILITYPEQDGEKTIDHVRQIQSLLQPFVSITCVPGGSTRQKSVHAGLEALTAYLPEMVLIHDGARPWITAALIRETYRKACETGGAAPGLAASNALKGIDKQGMITAHHQRTGIIEIQTPQIFRFSDILNAHRTAAGKIKHEYIDDTEVYTDWGGLVAVVPGDPANIKITYYRDLERLI